MPEGVAHKKRPPAAPPSQKASKGSRPPRPSASPEQSPLLDPPSVVKPSGGSGWHGTSPHTPLIPKKSSAPPTVRPKVPLNPPSRPPSQQITKVIPGADRPPPSPYAPGSPPKSSRLSPTVDRPTKPSHSPSEVTLHGSSPRPQGTAKQYEHSPGNRPSAWYSIEPRKVEVRHSPSRMRAASVGSASRRGSPQRKYQGVAGGGRTGGNEAHDPTGLNPPEFLAQQWGGGLGGSKFGWWQGSSLLPDLVTGTLHITTMDLAAVPPSAHAILEEKAVLDIARLFSHPPWHVMVSLEAGSLVLRYRLELPDPGPSAVSVVARAAAEIGRKAVRLPELERQYRICTGKDVPALIDFDLSEAPSRVPRAKPMTRETEDTGSWPPHNGPIEIRAVAGDRRMEVVGPQRSFNGSTVWPDLPALPPPLPATVAASSPILCDTTLTAPGALSADLPMLPGMAPPSPDPCASRCPPCPPCPPCPTTSREERVPTKQLGTTLSMRPCSDVVDGAVCPPPPMQRSGSVSSVLDVAALRCDFVPVATAPRNRPAVCQPPPAAPPAGMLGVQTPPTKKEVQAIRARLQPCLMELESQFKCAAQKGDIKCQLQVLEQLGNTFYTNGDYEAAVMYHSRQIEMLHALPDMHCHLADLARACSMLGNAYWALNDYEKALSFHQRRLEIAESQGDRRGMGAAYGNLGNVYHAMGDFTAATQYHLKHQALVDSDDMPTMGAVYHNLGLAKFGAGDLDGALDCFRHSLEISISVGNRPQVARVHGNLALVYKAKGRVQEAVNELHLELKTEIAESDLHNAASTCFSIGNIYVSQGDYRNGLQYYERGVDLCRWHAHQNGGARLGIAAKLLIAAGSCKYHIGQHQDAIANLNQALSLAKELQDKELEGAAHSNLGLCYHMLGDYDKALSHHKAHLEIARHTGNVAAEGAAQGNLGNTFHAMGDHNKAIDCYENDLRIALTTGDTLAQGQAYDNLGLACQKLGEYRLASEYHKKALHTMQQLGYRAGEAEAHAHLGAAYDQLGESKLAIQHHHAHLDIAKELGDLEGQGRAYGALGRSCFDFGMHQRAAECQVNRLRIAQQLGDSAAEARALGHLFMAYNALGDQCKAEEALSQHKAMCAKHGLSTMDQPEGFNHIRMEIAEAMKEPGTKLAAAERLTQLAQATLQSTMRVG